MSYWKERKTNKQDQQARPTSKTNKLMYDDLVKIKTPPV